MFIGAMMTKDFFDPDDFDLAKLPVKTSTGQSVAAAVTAEPVTYSEPPKFFELKPVSTSTASANSEPIRPPEPIAIPTDFPEFQAPEGYHVDISDLPIGSEEPLTRRQMREMHKLTGSEIAEPEVEYAFPFTSDLAEQVPTEPESAPELVQPIEFQANDALFRPSPGMLLEPTTNSIVIDQLQDLTNYTATVTETGEILTTGAIQLPILVPETHTGEIALVADADILDAAIAQESGAGFVSTVAPMRVTGVVNASKRSKVIPTNLKRGKSHPYLVLTAAIVIVAAGGLAVTAVMLGII